VVVVARLGESDPARSTSRISSAPRTVIRSRGRIARPASGTRDQAGSQARA